MDDLPDPERPRPSTWPGTTVRSRSCLQNLQEEIPGTWPPVEHAFDPLITINIKITKIFHHEKIFRSPTCSQSKSTLELIVAHLVQYIFNFPSLRTQLFNSEPSW